MIMKGLKLDNEGNIVGKLLPIANCTQCLYFIKEKEMIGCKHSNNAVIVKDSSEIDFLTNGISELMCYCRLKDYTYKDYHK